MRDDFDVAVIGGGLAGRMAALAAAEERASVVLLARSESTLRSSTGLVDLLGYHPDGNTPIADPFEALSELPPAHPLYNVGEAGIRRALEFFDSVVGEAYMGGHTDRNALVPTQLGTPKPAALYPRSFAPGLLSRDGDMLLLGLDGFSGLDGEFAAAELSARDLPYRVHGANVDLLGDTAVEQPRIRLAEALERNEPLPNRVTTIRDSLAAAIEDVHRDESRVGLPGVLGRTQTRKIREELESAVGAKVFEYPTDPPSIPGIRLAEMLDRAMQDRDIRTCEVVEIAEFSASPGQIHELRLADRDESVRANEYILSTGGLIGGGIVDRGGELVEPVFDLQVAGGEWTADDFDLDPFAPQDFAEAGIKTDGSLRPVGRSRDGEPMESGGDAGNAKPIYTNLRACGSVLGGFDFVVEHSGSGVAIATGVQTGRAAAREAIE